MYSYLFTNDLRISSLEKVIQTAGTLIQSNQVPKATEDKSLNNNINTLSFYFALTPHSNSTILASNGNLKRLVLNFIKKFQFPNPRTRESFQQCKSNGQMLAPMREIVKLLYLARNFSNTEGYLTEEEIRLFIFYNEAIAKRKDYNLMATYSQILKFRETGQLPQNVSNPRDEEYWKHETRQLREMLSLLEWSGCLVKDSHRWYINYSILTAKEKVEIFDILSYNSFWEGSSYDTKGYFEYMDVENEYMDMENKMKVVLNSPLQVIYYGAPGTGKSHAVNRITQGENTIRTTFHPDSDYSTFVGAYKPTMQRVERISDSGHAVTRHGTNEVVMDNRIEYSYVPQAFLKAYVEAWKKMSANPESPEPYYLVIEEINRGNCAQIFGDLFQLLDRDDTGFSSYEIHPDQDIEKWLREEAFAGTNFPAIQGLKNEVVEAVKTGRKMLLPANLHVFATMNTSDQSLFPIDSAFKRRWEWKYIPIAKGIDAETSRPLEWSVLADGKRYDWWDFLQKVNPKIAETTGSEDKKLGFFFVKADSNGIIAANRFVSKVIFYIWNDVFKDVGLDDDMFVDHNPSDSANDRLTFDKFFDAYGEPVEEKVAMLLDNLKVKRIDSNPEPATEPTE